MQQRHREIFIIIIKYANYCDLRMMKRVKSSLNVWNVAISVVIAVAIAASECRLRVIFVVVAIVVIFAGLFMWLFGRTLIFAYF